MPSSPLPNPNVPASRCCPLWRPCAVVGQDGLTVRLQNHSAEGFNDLRDDGVAEGLHSVNPTGKPISHSHKFGWTRPPMIALSCLLRSLAPPEYLEGLPLFFPSE